MTLREQSNIAILTPNRNQGLMQMPLRGRDPDDAETLAVRQVPLSRIHAVEKKAPAQ